MIQFGQIRLDGLVALVAWHALSNPLPGGLLTVLGMGMLCESVSVLTNGIYILTFSSAYLIVRYILNHVIYPPVWQQILLVAFISMIVVTATQIASGATELVWPWGVAQAFLNGITAPVWFKTFDWLILCIREISFLRKAIENR